MSLTFLHISDTHLPADGNQSDMYARTRAMVAYINTLPFPFDFVLHTGDIGNDQMDAAGYVPVREAFSGLKVPLYVIAGNHDLAPEVAAVVGQRAVPPVWYTFDASGVRFICLNSVVPQAGYGRIGDEQLAWLAAQLAEAGDMPLVITLHHHPFALDAPAIDAYILHDGDALHAVLKTARDRIRCVLYGHIHETTMFLRDGITYASVAATGLQLRSWPGQTDIAVDQVQVPGLNVVTLMENGTTLIRAWHAALNADA